MKTEKILKAVAKPAALIGGSSIVYQASDAIQAVGKDLIKNGSTKTGTLVVMAGRCVQIMAGIPGLMAVSSIVKTLETTKQEETDEEPKNG